MPFEIWKWSMNLPYWLIYTNHNKYAPKFWAVFLEAISCLDPAFNKAYSFTHKSYKAILKILLNTHKTFQQTIL